MVLWEIYFNVKDEVAAEFINDKLLAIGEDTEMIKVTQIPFPCSDPATLKPTFDLTTIGTYLGSKK